jgi:hypothetical protein
MTKTSEKRISEPQSAPPRMPSDSIPGLPAWVFIPENRGGNPPPDRLDSA